MSTMEHTNLDKVEVVYNDKWADRPQRGEQTLSCAKRLFSSVGDTVDAGECYYKEKLHEMKSLASPGELFRERWLRSGPMTKCWLLPVVLSRARASSSASSPGVWGVPSEAC